MAVVEIRKRGVPDLPREYIGLSTDSKPTSGVPVGSKFFERNTKIEYVYADDGWTTVLDIAALSGSLAQVLAYNVDDTLNYVQVVHGGVTYRQTMSYTDGALTGVSAWEAQE